MSRWVKQVINPKMVGVCQQEQYSYWIKVNLQLVAQMACGPGVLKRLCGDVGADRQSEGAHEASHLS